MHKNRRYSPFALLLLFLLVQSVQAQKGALQIHYAISLEDPSLQQFHVTTVIKNVNEPRLILSLPTWAPGWYTVENYFKNVLRFRITDASGKILPHVMSNSRTFKAFTLVGLPDPSSRQLRIRNGWLRQPINR